MKKGPKRESELQAYKPDSILSSTLLWTQGNLPISSVKPQCSCLSDGLWCWHFDESFGQEWQNHAQIDLCTCKEDCSFRKQNYPWLKAEEVNIVLTSKYSCRVCRSFLTSILGAFGGSIWVKEIRSKSQWLKWQNIQQCSHGHPPHSTGCGHYEKNCSKDKK